MRNFDPIPLSRPNPAPAATPEREPVPDDRRRSPRFEVSGACRIVVFDGIDAQGAAGSVRDVSREGIRIRSSLRALPGMKAQVFLAHSSILGEVRHCTPATDGAFDLGIRIEAVSGEDVISPDLMAQLAREK